MSDQKAVDQDPKTFVSREPLIVSPDTDRQLSTLLAILVLILGTLASSSGAIFVKISEFELGPFATIFNRFWMTTLALGLWLTIDFWWQTRPGDRTGNLTGEPNDLPPSPLQIFATAQWPWLTLAGVALAGDLLLAAWALTQTKVANMTILNNCSPLFASTGAWLLWGKHFDNRFKLGMVLALSGAILIGTGDFQISPSHAMGDLAAIFAALCFSIYLLCIERLRTYLSTIAILWGSSTIAALFTFLVTAWVEPQWFPLSVQGWLAIVGLALISQIAGQGLVTYSLKRISAGAVATTFLLEPVTPAIIAWWLFAEHLSLSNGLAFGVVALGIYLAVSSPSALDTGESAGGIILDPAEVCPIDLPEELEERGT